MDVHIGHFTDGEIDPLAIEFIVSCLE